MTKDQIIKMAREAGFRSGHITLYSCEQLPFVAPISATDCIPELERFASLVAATEREECAKLCDELEEHWSDYKDAALLNGDIELSNVASGEPRAARAISAAIRNRGINPQSNGD